MGLVHGDGHVPSAAVRGCGLLLVKVKGMVRYTATIPHQPSSVSQQGRYLK
jgi:hypothetical protein